jgi:hypothetical protein
MNLLGPAWTTIPETPAAASEKRRRIVEFSDLTVSNSGKLSYKGDAKKTEVNPIRFVGACAKGHLQDIDWRFITHRNGDVSCRKPLFWVERGVSSDPSDISVRCACGASVTLGDLYKPKFLGKCSCKSPWLSPPSLPTESCGDDLRLLPRSATNTYFAQTVTVISLIKGDDRLRQTIAEHKTMLNSIQSLPNFLEVLRALPQTKEAFKPFSNEEIRSALAKEGNEPSPTNINPRVAEFDMLANGAPTIGADTEGSFFYAETLPREALALQPPWTDFLRNVVKVHRLREVTCLYGFTRLEPPPTSAESELDEIQLSVNGADLARSVEWLPAIEQFGEGIFLHVAPLFMRTWLDEPRAVTLADRFAIARGARPGGSTGHRSILARDTGRFTHCHTPSWPSLPWNAAIRSPP